MNKITLLLLFCFLGFQTQAQNEFITTWKTDNPGTSNATSITIPTTGTGYNYDVSWKNDGVWETGFTGNATHNYGVAGTYTVAIRGSFPRIYFNNEGDRRKILSIEQWGNIAWSSMNRAFYGCHNLVGNATDIPNLTWVTDMSLMFYDALVFNGDIGNWDVSNVTNMSDMFNGANVFNQDIDSWDVSNVTTMSRMFSLSRAFNSDIGSWNVGNVTNMGQMFDGASAFNQDIGNWDVSHVTNMLAMFGYATAFNQDIGNWNVGNVNTMSLMFYNASAFNYNIGNWNVSNVTNMYQMFYNAAAFNQNIGNWNVSNVTTMYQMFINGALSTANYDALLIGWNTLTLKNNVPFVGFSKYCSGKAARANIISTFGWTITDGGQLCLATDHFITTWKTDNPGTSNATSIIIPTTGTGYNYDVSWKNDGVWETGFSGNATHDYGVAGTYTVAIRGSFPRIYFNNGGDRRKILSIEQWGTTAWSSMNSAFNGCSNLIGNATDVPDLSAVTDMTYMFANASVFNQDIGNWNLSNVSNLNGLFVNASIFNQDIGAWNVSNVTNMAYMFSGARAFNQDISNWNVGNVTNMTAMFRTALLFNQSLDSWNTSKVVNMNSMFDFAAVFNQSIGNWNVGNVTDMGYMFRSASKFNQNISNWDVSKVINMSYTFKGASVFNQDIGNWNVVNVTNMSYMFQDASTFNQDIGSWNIGNVNNMNSMFQNALAFNKDIGGWNVGNVTTMQSVFYNASSFNQNLGNWNVGNVNYMNNMFFGVTLSTSNYDAILAGWATDSSGTAGDGDDDIPSAITFHGGNSKYCLSEAKRQSLITTYSWSITDGGQDPGCGVCTGTTTYTTAGGWDNGEPDSNTTAVIAENYNTATGNIVACSLTVEIGATLTIGAAQYVEVQTHITNNGSIIVESEYDIPTDKVSMGSIVQVLDNGTATNNGTINVQYTTPYMVPKTFVVVGSPMTAETRNGAFAPGYDFFNHLTENFVPNPDVALQFPSAENFADDNKDNWLRYSGAVNPGEGYILRPQLNGTDGNKTYDFTFEQGTLHTGNIDFTVKYNSDKNSSPNVLANPYPSAISADDFIIENPLVDEVYFWNPLTPPNAGLPGAYNMNFSMEDISMYNLMGGTAAASDPTGTATVPSGFISTAEGFGFKATGAGTAHFTNAMRVTENNTTAPRPIPDNNDRVWVTVKNAQYQMQNTTLLGFSELATAGLDQGYDSRRLATVVSLYTHLGDGNKELGIQSRESFEDGAKVLMGFSTLLDANLEYTISVMNIEGPNLSDATVYLIDNELNILTNLNEDNYTFKADKGTYNNRFTIQFKAETILGNQQQELANIMLIPNPAKDVLNISNPQLLDLESLEIYDIRGRLVQTANLRAMGTVKQIDIQQLASASYFVKIIGKDGQITKRLLKE